MQGKIGKSLPLDKVENPKLYVAKNFFKRNEH